jgi:hypothetical protein
LTDEVVIQIFTDLILVFVFRKRAMNQAYSIVLNSNLIFISTDSVLVAAQVIRLAYSITRQGIQNMSEEFDPH